MKLRISNLGVINTMEIDMSKPFILFAGDNGTGKTYAATFLYSLILDLRKALLNIGSHFENTELSKSKKLKSGIDGEIKADGLYDLLIDYLKHRLKAVVTSMNMEINANSF